MSQTASAKSTAFSVTRPNVFLLSDKVQFAPWRFQTMFTVLQSLGFSGNNRENCCDIFEKQHPQSDLIPLSHPPADCTSWPCALDREKSVKEVIWQSSRSAPWPSTPGQQVQFEGPGYIAESYLEYCASPLLVGIKESKKGAISGHKKYRVLYSTNQCCCCQKYTRKHVG